MIGQIWFGPSFPTAPRPASQRGANHCGTDCCSRLPELRQSGQVPSSCHNCFGSGEVFYWISSILLFKKASIFMSYVGYLKRYFWRPSKIVFTTEESPGESRSIEKLR